MTRGGVAQREKVMLRHMTFSRSHWTQLHMRPRLYVILSPLHMDTDNSTRLDLFSQTRKALLLVGNRRAGGHMKHFTMRSFPLSTRCPATMLMSWWLGGMSTFILPLLAFFSQHYFQNCFWRCVIFRQWWRGSGCTNRGQFDETTTCGEARSSGIKLEWWIGESSISIGCIIWCAKNFNVQFCDKWQHLLRL